MPHRQCQEVRLVASLVILLLLLWTRNECPSAKTVRFVAVAPSAEQYIFGRISGSKHDLLPLSSAPGDVTVRGG